MSAYFSAMRCDKGVGHLRQQPLMPLVWPLRSVCLHPIPFVHPSTDAVNVSRSRLGASLKQKVVPRCACPTRLACGAAERGVDAKTCGRTSIEYGSDDAIEGLVGRDCRWSHAKQGTSYYQLHHRREDPSGSARTAGHSASFETLASLLFAIPPLPCHPCPF